MTTEDRTEWLVVAAGELQQTAAEVLIAACAHARRTCRHPAQIVPAIAAFAEDAQRELCREIQRETSPRLRLVPPVPKPPRQMTQAEVDALQPHFVSLGLKAGFLVRQADGRVVPAPELAQ